MPDVIKCMLIILLFFCVNDSAAQFDNRKYWDEGKLLLSDIKGNPVGKDPVHLSIMFDYYSDELNIPEGKMVNVPTAECYVIPEESFVKEEWKNNNTLEYFQLIFDMAEFYRRKMQTEFYQIEQLDGIDSNLSKYYSQWSSKRKELKRKSDFGRNSDVIEEWQRIYSDSLETYKLPIPFPKLIADEHNLEIRFGYGHMHLSGLAGSVFTPVSMTDLDIALKFNQRFKLGASAKIGQHRAKKEYNELPKNIEKGASTNTSQFFIMFGYDLLSLKRFSFGVEGGAGRTYTSVDKDLDKSDHLELRSGVFSIGFISSYRFSRRIRLLLENEYLENSNLELNKRIYALDFGISVMRIHRVQMPGNAILFKVGINWGMTNMYMQDED